VETGQVISEDYMPKVCGNFTLLIHIDVQYPQAGTWVVHGCIWQFHF